MHFFGEKIGSKYRLIIINVYENISINICINICLIVYMCQRFYSLSQHLYLTFFVSI